MRREGPARYLKIITDKSAVRAKSLIKSSDIFFAFPYGLIGTCSTKKSAMAFQQWLPDLDCDFATRINNKD
jgi:hypothetical protein